MISLLIVYNVDTKDILFCFNLKYYYKILKIMWKEGISEYLDESKKGKKVILRYFTKDNKNFKVQCIKTIFHKN